jgi:hypothetical protein
MLMDLERDHPDIRASMLKALGNVMPRHLLDRRLHPGAVEPSGPRVPAGAAPAPDEPPAVQPSGPRVIPLVAR